MSRYVARLLRSLTVVSAALGLSCDDPACTLVAPLCTVHTVDLEPTAVVLTQIGQTTTVEIVARDKDGNIVDVSAANPEWLAENPTIATVTPTANPLVATVTAVAVGETRVLARSELVDSTYRAVDVIVRPSAVATQLGIRTQPGNAFVGQVLSPQPVIELRDAQGGFVVRSGTVTATVQSGPGVLSGSTTVDVVNGVATFTNLSISAAGAHTLRFTSPGLTGVTSAAPVNITTPPVGGVQPWFNEDFSSYSSNAAFMAIAGNWSQNLSNTFSGCSPARSTSVMLDQTSGGYAGSPNAMRLNFPGMADCLPNRCDNQGAGRDLFEFNQEFRAKRHIWLEFAIRFAPDWEIAPPAAWGCSNAPDHKTVLLFSQNGDRWEVKVGMWGSIVTVGDPVNGQTLNPNLAHPHSSTQYWNGNWFLVRMEILTGTANGRYRVWMGPDANNMTLIHSNLNVNIPTREFRTLRMGSNRNTGTAVDTEWWVGRIRIYDQNPGW